MGYQTASANSLSDLLSAIQSFASAQGWTVDSGKAGRSDGSGECVNISKTGTDGTVIAGAFYSHTVDLGVSEFGYGMGTYTYAAYNGGQGNMAQTNGASTKTLANGCGTSAIVAYHLFAGPNHFHVVLEVISGTYTHFGFGMLDKLGTVTTGVYNYGRRFNFHYQQGYRDISSGYHSIPFDSEGTSRIGPSTILRADCDGFTPHFFDANGHADSVLHMMKCGWRDTSWGDIVRGLYYNQAPSTLTGRTLLVPAMVSVSRGGQMYSPAGYFPDVRYVRLDNIASSASIVIGSDTWRAFPYVRRHGAAGEPDTSYFGLAFLQRP